MRRVSGAAAGGPDRAGAEDRAHLRHVELCGDVVKRRVEDTRAPVAVLPDDRHHCSGRPGRVIATEGRAVQGAVASQLGGVAGPMDLVLASVLELVGLGQARPISRFAARAAANQHWSAELSRSAQSTCRGLSLPRAEDVQLAFGSPAPCGPDLVPIAGLGCRVLNGYEPLSYLAI